MVMRWVLENIHMSLILSLVLGWIVFYLGDRKW